MCSALARTEAARLRAWPPSLIGRVEDVVKLGMRFKQIPVENTGNRFAMLAKGLDGCSYKRFLRIREHFDGSPDAVSGVRTSAIEKARSAFLAVHDTYTLADFAADRDELRSLLHIVPASPKDDSLAAR